MMSESIRILKQSRSTAKSMFTRTRNSLIRKIEDGKGYALLESEFKRLEKIYSDLIEKADNYAAHEDCPDDAGTCNEWLESIFDSMDQIRDQLLEKEEEVRKETEKKLASQSEKERDKQMKMVLHRQEEERRVLDRNIEELQLINLQKRKDTILQIEEGFKHFETLVEPKEDKSVSAVEVEQVRKHLEGLMLQLRDINPLIVSKEMDTTKQEAMSNQFVKINQTFQLINSEAAVFIDEHDRNKDSLVKLKRFEMWKFNGDVRKYGQWKRDFVTHVRPALGVNQEVLALKSCVEANVMNEFDMLGDDSVKVWARLDEKYGNKRKLIELIVNEIKCLQPLNNTMKTVEMIDTVLRARMELEYLGALHEMNNTVMLSELEKKLGSKYKEEWVKEWVHGTNKTRFDDNPFELFIEFLSTVKSRLEYEHGDLRTTGNTCFGRTHATDVTEMQDNHRRPNCPLHPQNSGHPIWRCFQFKSMDDKEKSQVVKENSLCVQCLSWCEPGVCMHPLFKCKIDSCEEKHHTLLHSAISSGITLTSIVSTSAICAVTGSVIKPCLLQFQVITIANTIENEKNKQTATLWDSGSTLSLIKQSLAKSLKLTGTPVEIFLSKVGGQSERLKTMLYDVDLVSAQDSRYRIQAVGITQITNDIEQVEMCKLAALFGMNLSEITYLTSGQDIDLLVGWEHSNLHPQVIRSSGDLLLMSNKFGKIISGTHPSLTDTLKKTVNTNSISVLHIGHKRLEPDFFSLEQMGVHCRPKCGGCRCGHCAPGSSILTLLEESELKMISENLSYDHSLKRWIFTYPWIKDPKLLPNNKNIAIAKLKATERRLSRLPKEYSAMYVDCMNDMVKRGVAREISNDDLSSYQGPQFYISHHEIIKPQSLSTPCRIVFNSSSNDLGHVINDYWAKGADVLNPLLSVLQRFREEKLALCGDISKMYHQILTTLPDHFTHLYLWRNLDPGSEMKTYAMTVLNMGDRPSQCAAIVSLQKTADFMQDELPESVRVIKENSYLDDIVDSVSDYEQVDQRTREIENIIKLGSFSIKRWHVSGIVAPDESDRWQRILGLNWDKRDDIFQVKLSYNNQNGSSSADDNVPKVLTKRSLLSKLNRVYDPLGFVSPVTIKGKFLLRQLWAAEPKLRWDCPIPDEFKEGWLHLLHELRRLEEVSFKRCLKPDQVQGKPVLVLFSDFGKLGFDAVAYVRWELENGVHESRLLMAKNRVSPLKTLTTPRGELCGAVLQARIRSFISKYSRFEFERIYHLVDSEVVRSYIINESSKFNIFVANRIAEINDLTDNKTDEWYHLPRKFNIADAPTKGLTPEQIGIKSEWQCGPEFLKFPEDQWPISQEVHTNISDLPDYSRPVFTAVVRTKQPFINISQFSRYRQLLRVTARLMKLQANGNLQKRSLFPMANEITVDEIYQAETYWIKYVQSEIMTKYAAGHYVKLGAVFTDGIIYVGKRTTNWNAATWNNQLFILLPSDHPFTTLYALSSHWRSGHLGIAAGIAMVRSKFWVVGIKVIMKNLINACVFCRKKNETLIQQKMSPLPFIRLSPAPAFFRTGIDFFGPFTIRGEVNKRVHGKCYGVIMVCFFTRGVYIDISSDYSTDKFLMAFRRFVSIRGYPGYVYTDGGKQLVAASNKMKEIVQGLDWKIIKKFGTNDGLRWEFSPADSPHRNGSTERMVQTVKKALKAIIGDQVLSYPELQTVCFEAANLVNQRPIGSLPSTPDDGTYLCPNDVILGRASTCVPQGPFDEKSGHKYRFEFIQKLVTEFWKRWSTFYLPDLVIESKWHTQMRNSQVGDIVLLKDNNLLRGQWKLARVSEIIPSADGLVRTVKVMYKNLNDESGKSYKGASETEVIRSVQRLVMLLPVEEQGKTESQMSAQELTE